MASQINSSEHSLIAYNAVIQIIGRLFFLALSLVNIKLITNYLAPTKFGEYATILTFTGFFTVLIDLGLFHVAIREISKAKERMQEILSNVLTIRILSAIAATLLVIFLGYALPQYRPLGAGILIGAGAMFVYFLSNILDVVFHVNLKMQYISLVENVSKLATLLGVWLTVHFDLGLTFIIGAILFGSAVAIIPRYYLARRFVAIKVAYNRQVCGWLLRLALPLGLVFILNNIYFKIDSQMLYLLSTTYDAGLYGLAYRIMETTLFVASFIVAAITPTLSRTIGQDKSAASFLVSRAFEVLLASALLFFVTISLFSEQIVRLLADASYLEATRAISLLAAAAALIYLNSLFGQILIAADRRKVLVGFSIFLVLFNIGLNFILIPKYGFVGAAWSTLISELAILIFNLIVSLPIVRIVVDRRTILIVLLATAVSAICFTELEGHLHWLISLTIGLLAYLIIILKTNLLNWPMIKEIARGSKNG